VNVVGSLVDKASKLAIILVVVLGVVVGVELVQQRQEIREKAATATELYVRVSKSYILPGDSYTLYVFVSKMPLVGYTGQLDVTTNYCDGNGNNCNNYIGIWKGYDGNPVQVNNGVAKVNIPLSASPLVNKSARFRPSPNPNGFGWSNEISQSLDTTNNLINYKDYFIMPSQETLFAGTNNAYSPPVDFKTVIGFYDTPLATHPCAPGKVMYFIKDSPEAYWDPKTPWIDSQRKAGYERMNLLWYLVNLDMSRESGWYDGYIHAYGDERYWYNPTEPLTLANNFEPNMSKDTQYRYGSRDPLYPPYMLGPNYIGKGYGVSNSQASYTHKDSATDFCELPINGMDNRLWSIHIDKTSIEGYSDVLRLRKYEGPNSFTIDSAQEGLREDWYFAKGVGLVRIEQRYFCPDSWGDYPDCKPCPDDEDCILNEYMQDPHIELNRVGHYTPPTATSTPTSSPTNTNTSTPPPTATYTPTNTKTPTPTPIPGDLNGNGSIDINDYNLLINNFGNSSCSNIADITGDCKVNIFDYNILLTNFGK
jgi:hypothetical protein